MDTTQNTGCNIKKIAQAIHSNNIIVDAHCDTLIPVLEGKRSLGTRSDAVILIYQE